VSSFDLLPVLVQCKEIERHYVRSILISVVRVDIPVHFSFLVAKLYIYLDIGFATMTLIMTYDHCSTVHHNLGTST
jgi:hypothetical protein